MILAVDTETTGTDYWHGCRPFLITACDGRHNYHYEGTVNPYDRRDVTWDKDTLEEVQDLLEDSTKLIFHNAKFDLHMLEVIGIDLSRLWDKVEDTMLASHCLSSGESHALKYLAFKYMNYYNEDEQLLELAVRAARLQHKDYDLAKSGHPSFPGISGGRVSWWKMDYWLCPEECITYGLGDVERTWGLWQIFYEALDHHELLEQYETRKKLIRIAFDMEKVGYNVYADLIEEEIAYLTDLRESLTTKIKREAKIGGRFFDLNKEVDLRFLLFSVLKLTPDNYTEKSGVPSMSKSSIDGMIENNPDVSCLSDLQEYRTAGTQIGYLSSYLKWVCEDNRIRANVFITGTRETRQAYRDPNLQNIDKRLRHVFGPSPGYLWLDYDLVNIELRIWTYQVGNKELIEIFEAGGSVHLLVASIIFPDEWAQHPNEAFKKHFPDQYGWTKNGNFAIIYGATEKKADQTYHVPGAYRMIANRFPEVPEYTASTINEMWINLEYEHWPHVTCLGGYKLDVPPDQPFVACNYKIQGTAGYIMNHALINIKENPLYQKSGAQMIQQVHDSIVVEIKEKDFTEDLALSIKKNLETAGLRYLPTCTASYDIIQNTQAPF